ncbi:unnamed protein product [Arabidopsis thaliana]|uniref:Uncharacterized protein n=1 Tax=Arabidopsis thaliana TaxID=3702 RepID=Q9LS11_ARATH|nr:unnamed protein product [Arabidopsis thaliana]
MYETWQGNVFDTVGDCLMDMAKLGVTSEEKIELFSLPMYFPQFSEVRGVIEHNGSFTIELMETISHPLDDTPLTQRLYHFHVSSFSHNNRRKTFWRWCSQ